MGLFGTDGEFGLRIVGNWYQIILFEVPLLAIINEVYFRRTQPFTPAVEAEGGALSLPRLARLPKRLT